MRYLDAKKRLALMMAAVKYVRLYIADNPNIEVTNDDIKAAVVDSFRMVPLEYTITTEDITIITDGIKSILLKHYGKLKMETSVTLESRPYGTLKADDFTIFKEYLDIQGLKISSVEAESIFNTIMIINNIDIAVDNADYIASNAYIVSKTNTYIHDDLVDSIASEDKTSLFGNLNVEAPKPDEMTMKEFINVESNAKMNAPFRFLFGGESIFKTVANITLELQEIKYRLGTDSFITFKADTLLNSIKTFIIKTNTQIKANNEHKLVTEIADHLITDSTIDVRGQISLEYLTCLNLQGSGTTKVKNNIKLVDLNSVSLAHELELLFETRNELVSWMTDHIGVDDEIFSSSSMAIEFEEFVALNFEIDTIFTVKDLVELNKNFSLPAEIIAKLYVSDEVKFDILNGADIIHDYTLNIKDRVVLGLFKLAILKNFDDSYLSDIDDLFLDDMIYITRN